MALGPAGHRVFPVVSSRCRWEIDTGRQLALRQNWWLEPALPGEVYDACSSSRRKTLQLKEQPSASSPRVFHFSTSKLLSRRATSPDVARVTGIRSMWCKYVIR